MKKFSLKNIEDISKYVFSLKREKDYFDIIFYFKNGYEISSNDLTCLNDRKIEEYEIEHLFINYRKSDFTERVNVWIYNEDKNKMSSIEIESDSGCCDKDC